MVELAEKTTKKKRNSFKDLFKKIINSSHSLVIGLLILVLTLLWFAHHLISSNHTYLFSGTGHYVSILNGAISLNHDTHIFVGSHIAFIAEEDVILVNYTIGYYLRRGLEMSPLIVIAGQDEEGFSLRGLLQHNSIFNIIEPARDGLLSRRESLARISGAEGLYFIIEGTTIDGEEIYDLIRINLMETTR